MLDTLFSFFFAFWVALLPVYLWGYGTTVLLDERWNRRRFFLGVFIGSMAVGITYLYAMSILQWPLAELSVALLILGAILLILSLSMRLGSRVASWFLQRIAIIHVALFASVFLLLFLVITFVPELRVLAPILGVALLTPFIEESTKHLWSIGLSSQEFRFSERDVLAFSFFVVLGFVFAENLLYFLHWGRTLGEWIGRATFTLVAHIFTTLLFAHFWWKALAYPLGSLRYIMTILGGFMLAGILHIGYNFFLSRGSLLWLILYAIVGYILYVSSSGRWTQKL